MLLIQHPKELNCIYEIHFSKNGQIFRLEFFLREDRNAFYWKLACHIFRKPFTDLRTTKQSSNWQPKHYNGQHQICLHGRSIATFIHEKNYLAWDKLYLILCELFATNVCNKLIKSLTCYDQVSELLLPSFFSNCKW